MTLSPLDIPDLLRRFDIQPRKSLGQNFLADHNALLKIVRDAEVDPDDEVLEIGAGLGSLTRILAVNAKKVVAVEIDRTLFDALKFVTQAYQNVQLVHGDILQVRMRDLMHRDGYKVVANIPYYITSAVIRHLLEAEMKPQRLVLTMQREVAERIINADQKMSLLSLSVQVYGQARIASHIPADCFLPKPKVDSSVLIIDIYKEPKLSQQEIKRLFDLAHAAFNQKRKMLRSSLKSILGGKAQDITGVLEEAGIDPQSRPEVLSLGDWIDLVQAVKENSL
jgi:16S rRNA (adenine1518-N6/adenine1519-N6)-dimethyltransferase